MTALRIHNPEEIRPAIPTPRVAPREAVRASPGYAGREVLELVLSEREKAEYRRRLLARDPCCVFCGKEVDTGSATIDHLLPRLQGGRNQPANLWLSCRACNTEKSGRTPSQWAADVQAWADRLREACDRIGPVAGGLTD